MTDVFDSKSFLKSATRQPGVYQMFDATGAILYVGKAKNLKNRLGSYFVKSGLSLKTEALVKRIASIEMTVTGTEAEALVLEQNLIKAQRPPFNILLRDDKSYPYIFLSEGEDYPRIALHRGAKKKKGKYFGPFPNVGAVRESLQLLQKTFRVRQCEDSVFRNRSRPCLQYQIGRCTGPCVDLISPEDYAEDVRHTKMFIEGDSQRIHNELEAQMLSASESLDFEAAARYRDQISALRSVQAKMHVESGKGSADILACATKAGDMCVHVLFVRQGRILGSKSYFPKNKLQASESEALEEFVPQFYLANRAMDVPAEIILSHTIENIKTIEQAIKLQTGNTATISSHVKTHRASWLSMAVETAQRNLVARIGSALAIQAKFQALQQALNLDEDIDRIECFDISHSSGELTVASCVVFDNQGAAKKDYRRFNIKGIQAGDDYAAMEQALTRRYKRLQEEERPLPTLVLIDGGKGQMSKAKAVMAELGIQEMMLVGVAKGVTRKPGLETLVFEDGREVHLEGDSMALHLIQQIRDEAHRFAVTGHKNARDKVRKKSTLEDIPGVGATRRRSLLNHFGGIQAVLKASAEDLAKVPGISKKLAQDVYSILHSE